MCRDHLCMCPANERWCYNVMSSVIGWAHTRNDLWLYWRFINICIYKNGTGSSNPSSWETKNYLYSQYHSCWWPHDGRSQGISKPDFDLPVACSIKLIVAQWCHMVTEIWVNIGSGNGLLPDGTKPLLEPVLIYHQWDLVAFTWGNFRGNARDIYPWYD